MGDIRKNIDNSEIKEAVEIRLRRYEESDKESVLELNRLALGGIDSGLDGPWNDDLKNIESTYIKAGGEFLVGDGDNKLVAMGGVKKISDEIGEVKRMRVHPDYQKKGAGKLMLQQLEDSARILGFKELQLETTEIQTAAQRLYAANGYSEYKRGILDGYPCIFYRKILEK